MALTVESGAGDANADSLITLEEMQSFASVRGETISDDEVVEQQIRKAHDYLVRFEDRFQGWRRVETQALPFPREPVYLYGRILDDGAIPTTLKNAICQLVIEGLTLDVLPTSTGQIVTGETVGPISTTYAAQAGQSPIPGFPRVDAYLSPLFKNKGLSTLRV